MKATILVVDDQPMFERLIRNLFRNQINDEIYNFVFALNGIEALKVLENNLAIDMVLCDINMPLMDGLTFLGKVRELRPNLKVVMEVEKNKLFHRDKRQEFVFALDMLRSASQQDISTHFQQEINKLMA